MQSTCSPMRWIDCRDHRIGIATRESTKGLATESTSTAPVPTEAIRSPANRYGTPPSPCRAVVADSRRDQRADITARPIGGPAHCPGSDLSSLDRRFKENRDPAARLGLFVKDLRASFADPDATRTLRRFPRPRCRCMRTAGRPDRAQLARSAQLGGGRRSATGSRRIGDRPDPAGLRDYSPRDEPDETAN